MGGPTAAVDGAGAARPPEYYYDGSSPADCEICGTREGLFFVGQEEAVEADADVGLSQADQMLTTEEVFVPHALDAPVTKAGLIDALSILHPTWAGVLYCLCCDGGDLGQGYEFHFVENPQDILDYQNARLDNVDRAQLDERIAHYQWLLPQYQAIEEQFSDGGMLHPPARVYEERGLDPNLTSGDIMHELRGMGQLRNGLDEGRRFIHRGNWVIDTEAKVIRASAWINDDRDDPIPDGFVDRNVTNRQAADWLALHLSSAFGDGEFFWDFILRYATGTVLMALGAGEMFVGATAVVAAGWTGGGAVAGAALTVTGWNAFEAGARMWATPDSSLHRTALDQVVNKLGTAAFGAENAYLADRGWSLAQILVGVGAATVIARGTTGTVSARTLANGSPTSGQMAALTLSNIQMAIGRGVKATRMPSLSGVHLEIPGIGKVLARASDADARWLLHILMTPPTRLRQLVDSAAARTGRSANPPIGARTGAARGPVANPTAAQIAKAEELGVDPRWIKPDGSVDWPPNRGFDAPPTLTELQPNTRIDRYGGRYEDGVFVDTGTFVSPSGVPFEQRALPPATQTRGDAFYNEYIVVHPIPGVQSGPAAPWFGAPGGGTQFELPMGIDDLVEQGFIRPLF